MKDTISAIILKLLSKQERMYGYEISQRVKELSAGKITMQDGSLYPALQKIFHDGLLSFKEEQVGAGYGNITISPNRDNGSSIW